MSLELIKTTKSVLSNHRLPYDSVEAIEATMRESKKRIDGLLQLSPENLFRAKIVLEKTEEQVRKERPYTCAIIKKILVEAAADGAPIDPSTISVTKNAVTVKGQEQRLSKVLSKHLVDKEALLALPMKELGITRPEQFLPKLGDIVKSGRILWLSTNLLDFLTASDNAAFRSCHSFDGQHFNGNIAYARDKMTIMTFVSDAKATTETHQIHKLGRSWLFLSSSNEIVQPRSYGAYDSHERKTAKDFIISKLAEKEGVNPGEYKATRKSYTNQDYSFEMPADKTKNGMSGYFDAGDVEVAYLSKKVFSLPKLEFAAAACLVCGKTTDYPNKGICSEHDGRVRWTCTTCGEKHLADNCITVNGEHYCQNCYSKKFQQCNHCHEHHLKEDLQVIDGHRTCKACLKKHYTECSHCGSFHRKDKMNVLEGISGHICNACVEHYLLCSICNKYHAAAEVVYHTYVGRVCPGCLPNVAFRCNDCGEYHTFDSRINMDGAEICPACDAKRKGKVLELKAKPKYAGLPEGWEDFVEEIG